jgi:hypothetical protein
MKRLLASLLILLSLTIVSTPLAFAEEDNSANIKDSSSFDVFDIFSLEDGITEDDVLTDAGETSPAGALILKAINILTLLIGTFAFIMIIIGGFMFATAGGEENKVDRGKAIITQSIFGLIIAFFSYMIVVFIQSFFY